MICDVVFKRLKDGLVIFYTNSEIIEQPLKYNEVKFLTKNVIGKEFKSGDRVEIVFKSAPSELPLRENTKGTNNDNVPSWWVNTIEVKKVIDSVDHMKGFFEGGDDSE